MIDCGENGSIFFWGYITGLINKVLTHNKTDIHKVRDFKVMMS
jgi:hypothetical protein